MIQGLTKDQEKKMKSKATASLAEQRSRKWIYNDSKQGVLVETDAQFDEIKGIFDLSKPNCANSEVQVIKFGEAKKQVNQARRDLAAADEKAKVELALSEAKQKEAKVKAEAKAKAEFDIEEAKKAEAKAKKEADEKAKPKK